MESRHQDEIQQDPHLRRSQRSEEVPREEDIVGEATLLSSWTATRTMENPKKEMRQKEKKVSMSLMRSIRSMRKESSIRKGESDCAVSTSAGEAEWSCAEARKGPSSEVR